MKTMIANIIGKAFLALGAICLLGISVQAQTYSVSAKVPFDFQVANTVLPTGTYSFGNSAYTHIAQIRNQVTGRTIFVPTGAGSDESRPDRKTIVFHQYGNERFLAEIWTPSGVGTTLPACSREKELLKASKPMAKVIVPLAAFRAD